VPEEKIFKNISKYGNTSAATIPIALDEMNEAGMLKEGQKILLATFGAGFTWASMIIET
jgi:3-oxoacyl-[acyl-carrier-protein] synthase-3